MFVREYKGRDGRQYKKKKTDLTLYILMALEVVELLAPGGRREKKIGGQWVDVSQDTNFRDKIMFFFKHAADFRGKKS